MLALLVVLPEHFARGRGGGQNMGVATETSEFSYLPQQAQALDVPVPPAERVTLHLPDGRMLSALRYGDDPPAITLLHGAGLNAHTWDTTVLLLQRPALVIDFAGHGDSSWREDLDYAPRVLAADIVTALEEWTSEPQILVGQSLGGLTAAAVASSRPELVRELITVDITPGIAVTDGPAVLREFYAGSTDFASRDELVDRAISFGLGGSRSDTERGVFFNSRVRADGRVEWKHHFAHLAAQGFTSPISSTGWDDLSEAEAPITLVRATSGFVSEADSDELMRRVPTARVIAMDASHNVQETAPAELADLIRAAERSPA